MAISRREFLRGLGTGLALAAVGCGGSPRNSASLANTPPTAPAGKTQLTGLVVRPGDAGYEAARTNYNARFSISPSLVVFASSPTDVANAIRWSRENGVALRPRSGRHSYEAYSLIQDGLVLDVSPLASVAFDAGTGRARIGAGAALSSVWEGLAASGVMIPTGSCATLGMAGLALGGGVGFSARKHGLTCDAVTAVDLVTADGNAVHASADENAELFWALRGGGGGNLGVVTGFELQTYPADRVATYYISWPLSDFEEVMAYWQSWAPYTDPDLFATLAVDADGVSSSGQLHGDSATLQNRIADLMRVGSANGPHVQELSYLDAAKLFGAYGGTPVRFKSTSGYLLTALPSDAMDLVMQRIQAAPGKARIQFDAFGGAIPSASPTAFAHRQAIADVQMITTWSDPADEAANLTWVADTRQALAGHLTGAYVNYIDSALSDFANQYYGASLAQLQQAKRTWDPDGVFGFPQAIPAASLS